MTEWDSRDAKHQIRSLSARGVKESGPSHTRLYSHRRPRSGNFVESVLPRKSFFNCHDRALNDARNEANSAIQPAYIHSGGGLPRITESSQPSVKERVVSADLNSLNEGQAGDEAVLLNVNQDSQAVRKYSADSLKSDDKGGHRSYKASHSKQRVVDKHNIDDDEDVVTVDHRPLSAYLKHIADNPSDYGKFRSDSAKAMRRNETPVKSLIATGNAFHRRNSEKRVRESLLVHAVHELKPRFSNPNLWTLTRERQRHQMLFGLSLKHESKHSDRGAAEASIMDDGQANENEGGSEFEKARSKVLKWMRTLSTAQLNKAKELALKDNGDEDEGQSKWWDSLQACRYLRVRKMTLEDRKS